MYLPLVYNARLMRRAVVSGVAALPSPLWVPVRNDEPKVGAELCQLLGWECNIAPESVEYFLPWCWRWLGYHDRDGYARINVYGTSTLVSRVWASICYGALSEKEDAHHTCKTKWCVNPAHMEPLPRGKHYQIHGYIRQKEDAE